MTLSGTPCEAAGLLGSNIIRSTAGVRSKALARSRDSWGVGTDPGGDSIDGGSEVPFMRIPLSIFHVPHVSETP